MGLHLVDTKSMLSSVLSWLCGVVSMLKARTATSLSFMFVRCD